MSNAAPPVHLGCAICGSATDRLVITGRDRRCDVCGSLCRDRIMHAVLTNDLQDEVNLLGARLLLFSVGNCQTSCVFRAAEQYRCGSVESEEADLIAEPSDLASLPDNCFDGVVANHQLADRTDLDTALSEMRRVLMPGGWLLVPAPDLERDEIDDWQTDPHEMRDHLERHYVVRTCVGVDPATRTSGEVYVGRKDAPPLDAQPSTATDLTGYPYHLSRKAGRRIVFCLDGPLSAGDRLPIETVTGEPVGHVAIGAYAGGRSASVKPWKEGFRFPPRATLELDSSLPSGVYTAGGKIPFVHRSQSPASVAVLIPSHTAVAFNDAGGRSLYSTSDSPSANTLSFHRPLKPHLLLNGCVPFVKWFAKENPYAQETTYLIDSDLEEPDALDDIEVLIVIGRSEYWTRTMRKCFDAFVNRGGRALLLCSEIMHWQVRVDLLRHQLYRYLGSDPHPNPLLRTTFWHDPSLRYPIYPRTGCELWHGGSGAVSKGFGWDGMRIVCPDSPLLQDVGLVANDILSMPDTTEWDGAPVNHGSSEVPQVDFGNSPPWRHEVIGYNLVKPAVDELPPGQPATSLWIVLRHIPNSGTVIHGGSMGWCGMHAVGGHGKDSERIRAIILRMLILLCDNAWPFSCAQEAPEAFSTAGK